jgi:hypothetical protein
MMLECEMKSGDQLHPIGIEDALANRKRDFWCIECRGPVRPHRQYNNGVAAHFEHKKAHPGCSQIPSSFQPSKSKHPDAPK